MEPTFANDKEAQTFCILRVFNFLGFLFFFMIQISAQARQFGGANPGDISHKYDTNMSPVDQTFLIWSVIFILQILFTLLQFAISRTEEFTKRIGFSLILVWISQSIWTVLFCNELIVLSFFFILLSYFFSGLAFRRIQSITPVKPVLFYLTFSAQISINFAWLSVATAAQFFVLMKHLNIQIHPMAAPIATILLTVLNLALAFQFKCVPILVTMVWALGGLAMKQHQNQSQFVPFVVSLVNLFLCAISAIEILVTWNSSTFKPLLNRKKAE